jgi:uncharacterized protein
LYWLWRLDEEWRYLAGEVADNVRLPPSQYFRRQGFVTVEPDEPNLLAAIEALGPETALVGTDSPHLDHDQDLAVRLAGPDGVLPAALRQLVCDVNPRRWLGLPR